MLTALDPDTAGHQRSGRWLAIPLGIRVILLVIVAGIVLTLNIRQGLFDIPPGIVGRTGPLVPHTQPHLEIRVLGSFQQRWVTNGACELSFPDREDHEFAVFFLNYRATSGEAPFGPADWRVWIDPPDPEAQGRYEVSRPYTRWAFISSPETDRIMAPWEAPCEVPHRNGVPELRTGHVGAEDSCDQADGPRCEVTGWIAFEVPAGSRTFIEYRTNVFQEREAGLGPAQSELP